MSNNDFRDVRLASQKVREKLAREEKITAAELEDVKKHARMNPNADSIGLYVLAKRSLKENNNEE